MNCGLAVVAQTTRRLMALLTLTTLMKMRGLI